jgi:hypothetical protein
MPHRTTWREGTIGLALGALILSLALGSIGCAGGTGMAGRRAAVLRVGDTKAAVIPPLGILYSHVRAPLMAVAPSHLGTRRGEASVIQLATPPLPGIAPPIPLVAWGDASMEAAAGNAGIRDVTHMDYELTTVLMVWRRLTVITYGD